MFWDKPKYSYLPY